MSSSLSSCFYDDCGTDETGTREFGRLERLVLPDSGTTYVHFDLWAEGNFTRFDSTSNDPPALERRDVHGLGDTLRFHFLFSELYYHHPNDSVSVERFLKVAATPERAITPRPSIQSSWNCRDARTMATRSVSLPDAEDKVACSLPDPYHHIQRILVEYEANRKVVIGF